MLASRMCGEGRDWHSAVSRLSADPKADALNETVDELVALVIGFAADVGVLITSLLNAVDLSAIDLVELHRSIEGYVDEHDGQGLLQGASPTPGISYFRMNVEARNDGLMSWTM